MLKIALGKLDLQHKILDLSTALKQYAFEVKKL